MQLRKEQEQLEEVEERKYHCYESIVGAGRRIIDKTPFVSGGKEREEKRTRPQIERREN